MSECLFCNIFEKRILTSNNLAYVIHDGYPVVRLHSLIIPKRHVSTYFDLTAKERAACHDLIIETKAMIEAEDKMIDGFNIGINNGESAGQTIFHCHIHLIPRRSGDMENPRGGVRGVIPDKRLY